MKIAEKQIGKKFDKDSWDVYWNKNRATSEQ